jgi:hypothetical protein
MRRGKGLVGSFVLPLNFPRLICSCENIPFIWVLVVPLYHQRSQPLESRLCGGGGQSPGALTLGPETGINPAAKGLGTPLPPIHTPTPHAPVPEAAVWMTSSHKHALFLRKWKVSEVWWGAGCLQQ